MKKKKLIEITPSEFRCGTATPACPAMFKSNQNTYIIIGRAVSLMEHPGLSNRVGSDETLIEISAELVESAIRGRRVK